MIESLSIEGIPCFKPDTPPLQPLTQVTFLYGPNGSGKSSIAKSLNSVHNQEFTQELFDKEFVDLLLRPDQHMPGVFVIRDGDPDVQKRIDQLAGIETDSGKNRQRGEIEEAKALVTTYEKSIANQEQTIATATETLTNSCWKKRKALPELFQEAFNGFLGSSKKNVNEVLNVRKRTTIDDVKSEEELLASYETLGDESSHELQRIEPLPPLGDLSPEQKHLLEQPIKTRDATSFGDFIRLLENSDWVRQGLQYLDRAGSQCPFCQQAVSEEIADSLNALFDHLYEDQLHGVQEVLANEKRRATEIQSFITKVSAISPDEKERIVKVAEALQQRISGRIQQVELKIAAPSSQIALPTFSDLEIDLTNLVISANDRINGVNSMLRNRKHAKTNLKAEVWRYYVHSVVDNDLSTYDGAVAAPTNALKSLRPKFDSAKQSLREKQDELSRLQQELTSAVPTVNAINRTLQSLGFFSFSIQHHNDDDSYQLIRGDGTPAGQTLSEGERSLISFLYYFHKLIQLHEDKSVSEGIVAVIDDPVSSLDGEMLFVINLLLRTILDSCVKGTGRLKQVILLTHNAYFFKESEFTPKGVSPGNRSYFVLMKGSDGSRYKHYDRSPIKSNYLQLWDQVRTASEADTPEFSAWLPNAMRRIIENYFHITGGIDTDKVIAKIPESDRWACKALLAWYNDGSHTAPWDVDYSSISSDATTYIRAFRQIFDAAGHSAHYEMMMQN
ncbi:AAA family ATPase [Corynebacterium testudinoris]|uniref:AAA family ATPase n=1 Tax=Corynebacterium testudinoris TaxID=136857 RepID=UPI001C8C7B51|nr:AAA family ATPase [Corynebacterium testudinoris]MBX8996909.1 AAA family ATPase [Corynebacterium testudinoris]